jgi:hypothetical protein
MIWLRAIEAALPGRPDSSKLAQPPSSKTPQKKTHRAPKIPLIFIPSK